MTQIVVFLLFCCAYYTTALHTYDHVKFKLLHHSFHPTRPLNETRSPTITPSVTSPPTQSNGSYTGAPPTAAPTEPTTPAPTQVVPYHSPTNKLQYLGGLTMAPYPKSYLLFYGDWESLSPGTMEILIDFTMNLDNSPLWATQSTLYHAKKYPGSDAIQEIVYATKNLTFGGYYLQTNYTRGKTIDDGLLLNDAFSTGTLPYDPSGIYMIMAAPDVRSYFHCTGTCGWHFDGSYLSQKVIYGFIGPVSTCLRCGIRGGHNPTDDVNASGMASILFHELVESFSNPRPDAWEQAGSGRNENADMCSWNYGSTFHTAPNGQQANVQLGNRHYMIQQVWTNVGTGGCILSYP